MGIVKKLALAATVAVMAIGAAQAQDRTIKI
ncbi:amino acid ABC transporter, partial [Salmonella enterica subsp. enterica serovar Virchow]|nr:amino acid ABC transporter [Salmonella enterica subsp. enterica serovar Virchow]